MKAQKLTWGTSYFVDFYSAMRYYKTCGHYENVNKAVKRKLESGEIHLGEPPLRGNQELVLLDKGRRYGIRE